MRVLSQSRQLVRSARLHARSTTRSVNLPTPNPSLWSTSLCIHQSRHYKSNQAPSNDSTSSKETAVLSSKESQATRLLDSLQTQAKPAHLRKTPEQIAQAAAARAKAKSKIQQDEQMQNIQLGGLADNSLFVNEEPAKAGSTEIATTGDLITPTIKDPWSLDDRDPGNLAVVLNPRPSARSRWQRRMVIRSVRHRGRLTKEMKLARSERSSLSRSHFFKTSMKKLAPLARQIAGKPIDEAILQMRFSSKKASKEVHTHLIKARNEAIVARGMGLGLLYSEAQDDPASKPPPFAEDPASSPPLPHQTPTKSNKTGLRPHQTDIYVSQAWVNRGPYDRKPDYRAFGRTYIMRPPHTGLSVLLKEEKTRMREKAQKAVKAVRRRMGKNMWTQLPDRPILRQQQQLLW